MPRATPHQRFTRKYVVNLETRCWIWQGCSSRGYPQFTVNARTVYAHRWAYERHVGPIPRGMQLDHLCANTMCVNPEHLEPVQPWVNLHRGNTFQAHNAQKTHCKRGHPLSGPNLYVRRDGGRVCRACRSAWRKAHPRPADKYHETRTCTICGADFRTSRYHGAQTCSKACASVLCSITKLAA